MIQGLLTLKQWHLKTDSMQL